MNPQLRLPHDANLRAKATLVNFVSSVSCALELKMLRNRSISALQKLQCGSIAWDEGTVWAENDYLPLVERPSMSTPCQRAYVIF